MSWRKLVRYRVSIKVNKVITTMSKGVYNQVTQERIAELREAWALVADQKTALTSKEVYQVYRALGLAPTEHEHSAYFVRAIS